MLLKLIYHFSGAVLSSFNEFLGDARDNLIIVKLGAFNERGYEKRKANK